VRVVAMGRRANAPRRTLDWRRAMRNVAPERDGVDVMLVRGPSPLLPYFRRVSGRVPVAYYLQADYRTAPAGRSMPAWRRALVRAWKELYAVQQSRALEDAVVLVNSSALARSVRRRTHSVHEVISSVVREGSIEDEPAGGSGPPFRLAYAGRIVEEKGLLELADALADVLARGVDATLSLYGDPDDAAFARMLDERIERLGLRERVRREGYVPLAELTDVLRHFDLFVLASYHEGFPHVLLDAMAAGLPVLATRVGGIPDRLTDGEQAIIVEPRSARDLADGIVRAACDDDLRKRLAAQGAEWVRDHTVEKTCARVIAALEPLALRATA